MKLLNAFLVCVIVSFLGLVFYSNRALYFSRFDNGYWKDKYEHSQWKLPLSERTLGDDGLYLYEGYRLIHGEDPTTLNAEAPPLGKYLIGASIAIFGNGYMYGFITTSLVLVSCFLLAYTLTTHSTLSLLVVFLVALDPLIASQFTLTMLDSQQLLFAILTLWILTMLMKTKKPRTPYSLVAMLGVIYGLFTATKAPIFSPLLGIITVGTLLFIYRSLKPIALVFLATFLTYLLPYAWYFHLGHTFIDWLGVQKWILAFYRGSYVSPNLGSVITTLFFNRYQNLFSRAWEPSSHFTLAWPILMICFFIGLYWTVRRKGKNFALVYPVGAFIVLSLGFLSIIPFWTRYLVAIVPFLYLIAIVFIIKQTKKYAPYLIVGLFCFNVISVVPIIFPTPKSTVVQFLSDWRHGFFQDVYEASDFQTKQSSDRLSFYHFGRQILYDAQIEDAILTIKPYQWRFFTSPQIIPIHITYKTRNLGTFEEDVEIPLIKENGQWHVSWQWEYLLRDLTTTSILETTVDPAKRGTLFAHDGIPLAEDKESVLVWLIPNRIEKETENLLFQSIESLYDKRIQAVHFHERYVRLGSLSKPIPLGVIMHPIDPETEKILKRFPSLFTTKAYGRFTIPNNAYDTGSVANSLFSECCSLLYNTTSYDGRDGLEKTHNATLKGENGGTLVLKDKDGRVVRTIIQKTKRDGENVRL